MVCHGGFSLDETTRRSSYNPDDILRDLHVGMVFCDIGCGDGYFTILAAKKVGEKGKVYAVDTDELAIKKLKQKAENDGLRNIIAKVASAEETVFCTGCADFVFLSMVLHDFFNPAKVLLNSRRMLKHEGRVVDLDWKKQEVPFSPPFKIRFDEAKASSLMREAGFKVDAVSEAGRYHYVVVAKPLP